MRGIKIPSGQIANGGFNVAAGQTKDLDIDFNTCVSIVEQGNKEYRLKPVLHAGEVSTGLIVTVPALPNQSGATLARATESSSSCATGTDCVNYTIPLPASAPYVGAFGAAGTTLTQSALPLAYTVDGIAFVPSSGGTTDCSVGELQTTPVVPVAGATVVVPTLAFTGCQ